MDLEEAGPVIVRLFYKQGSQALAALCAACATDALSKEAKEYHSIMLESIKGRVWVRISSMH
jgi:hypothetical protein